MSRLLWWTGGKCCRVEIDGGIRMMCRLKLGVYQKGGTRGGDEMWRGVEGGSGCLGEGRCL